MAWAMVVLPGLMEASVTRRFYCWRKRRGREVSAVTGGARGHETAVSRPDSCFRDLHLCLQYLPMDYLLKTEPTVYSFADLEREKTTIWDGVTNPVAVKH